MVLRQEILVITGNIVQDSIGFKVPLLTRKRKRNPIRVCIEPSRKENRPMFRKDERMHYARILTREGHRQYKIVKRLGVCDRMVRKYL